MGTSDEERRFRALFEAEARDVLGYALRRVEDREDAADVVAETFGVAWRRIDEVPAGVEGRLWLFGVARRVLSNQRRGALRRRRLADRMREQLRLTPDPGRRTTSARRPSAKAWRGCPSRTSRCCCSPTGKG